jgi:hypothetical protein
MITRNPSSFGREKATGRSVRMNAVPARPQIDSTIVELAPTLESVSTESTPVEPIMPTVLSAETPLKTPESSDIGLGAGRYWTNGVLITLGADGVSMRPESNRPQNTEKFVHSSAIMVGGENGVMVSIVPARREAEAQITTKEDENAAQPIDKPTTTEELNVTESEVERG